MAVDNEAHNMHYLQIFHSNVNALLPVFLEKLSSFEEAWVCVYTTMADRSLMWVKYAVV